MLLPLYHQQQQQPLTLPKTFPDRIFPPFLVPKTLNSRCNVRRANSVVVCSSASADRKTLPQSAIQRIAEKLRSLGFVEEKHDSPTRRITGEESGKNNSPGEIFVPLPKQLPIHRVGHTIDTSWSTPTYPVPKPGSGTAISRYHELKRVWKKETEIERKKEEKVPSLAELTLPPAELRRLRSAGIRLTKKLKIGKAGITEGIVNGIHERWRTTEVVKIFCEDISRMNMKRTHDVLETKTGGLVIWRSGSKILLYRGVNYQYPYFVSDRDLAHETASGASSMDQGVVDSREKQSIAESSALSITNKMVKPMLMQGVGSPNKVRFQLPGEVQLVEEADRLLEGLGPRFTDWWAYDPLPVDGDLLPAVVPEYRRPFRLLPYGISPKLTDDEMTTIRRLGRPLPSHFALGRNRNLQGLAVAILKLWEKCELAKIAVKRGVQNTNSELMAEELKWLTGGTLISRDKDFIVLYRGKDFLPAAVSSAIEERRRQTMIMEKSSVHGNKLTENEEEIKPRAVKDDIELETKDQKDHIQTHQMKPRQWKSPEAILEKTSMKLSMVLEKKANAEKILADLENRESPQLSDIDKEGITNDEKYMLRKIGLKMKPFLLLGRRGVFDGTIENMHLHWKYRELVKIICNEHSIEAAHEVAEILEAESGGILVAVEMVSKGYAIIVYRGKNYERPPCLRPQTLLSKREALKRSVEAQRRKSLKLHVLKLSNNIEELNRQLVEDSATNETWSDGESSNRMAEEETENQHTEPDKSREGIELGYSCDLSVPSSGEENWEDDSEGEVDPFTTSSHEYQEDESGFGSSQRHDGNSLDSSANISVLAESSSANASSFHDRSMPQKSFLNAERKLPAGKELGSSTESGSGVSALRERKSENNGLVTDLSNRERLILRKQALKMKKRPPFAVGRSNVVTGLARTLKMHFQKNPLAIVNVKGRANGTSVQEVIAKLKEETGALLVSQEPSKVILYRGWGAEEEMKSFYPNNNVKSSINLTSTKSFVEDPPHVSPALIEAIRLECGL
ncbi:RNA-binding CRM domain [Arabidopsis thaliana x Arabidopsis arenosa]|uniref:RNA-binding CRM domain n=1 Tax=Arabidopsis thaliana x Arabidopsis arenosa TaxID=1240361 RepID=A0A8T2AU68_9BRAS|nr:RNA-binding CRM domain [Arabidopsis thaliana x Arabidopsis arenosa]KAG7575594.1 RNA-binding CRM domain [Arabidopsis thaliana x Arabidopsis arenosa]